MTVMEERAASTVPQTTPRTWSFIDRRTGERVMTTCMPGCTLDHSRDVGRRMFREDVWCWFWTQGLTLPINADGETQEHNVLSTLIKMEPWSPTVAQRLPYAVIELVEDEFIDGLDPDGLAMVISTLQDRLEQMRATHRELVALRATYMTPAV